MRIRYPRINEKLGRTMFGSIDRVYDPGGAARRTGVVCRAGSAERLRQPARTEGA